MPIKDKEKRLAYRRKWYARNRASEIKHVVRRKKQIRQWIANHKSTLKCNICSENHPATIDFHHVRGKDFEISHMAAHGYSINRIKGELKKCQVLCSNCHRKIHYQNRKL